MAAIADKLKQGLDENRMLMLGVQVLIGFEYQSILHVRFFSLPRYLQWIKVADLTLLIGTLACLFTPAMYHQIGAQGRSTAQSLNIATVFASAALMPFAIALGLSVFAAADQLFSSSTAVVVAAGSLAVTLFCWYGLELAHRRTRPERQRLNDDGNAGGTIKDRIDHVLTEARTILPGAQALLGFQFITMLSEAFERLPASSKYVHFVSLLCIALSTVLLLTPAAYHRIVERGEDTGAFHRFASRVLLFSTVPLALGLAGDFFVVVRKLTEDIMWSVVAAGLALTLCYGLWFGLALAMKVAKRRRDALTKAL
jgi:Family of unknown function (DUF6328)